MDPSKSPTPVTNPIQNLVQQLANSMANTQHHRMNASSATQAGSKPSDVMNAWGHMNPAVVQPAVPNQWGATTNNTSSWEYRDQMAMNQKLVRQEDIIRKIF
jgi:hypothetical protein